MNEGLRSTIEELQKSISKSKNMPKEEQNFLHLNGYNDETISKLNLEYSILKKKYDKLESILSEKMKENLKNNINKEKEVEEIMIENIKLKNEIFELENRFKESNKSHFELIEELQENEMKFKNTQILFIN